MYVVVINVHVKAESLSAFIAATRENHLASRQEPGNVRFDILQRKDDPNRFVFYEAYHDESGQLAHQQTAHYAKWKETVADMMAEPRSPQKCDSLFPEPWK